jgi:hypothetical protein
LSQATAIRGRAESNKDHTCIVCELAVVVQDASDGARERRLPVIRWQEGQELLGRPLIDRFSEKVDDHDERLSAGITATEPEDALDPVLLHEVLGRDDFPALGIHLVSCILDEEGARDNRSVLLVDPIDSGAELDEAAATSSESHR